MAFKMKNNDPKKIIFLPQRWFSSKKNPWSLGGTKPFERGRGEKNTPQLKEKLHWVHSSYLGPLHSLLFWQLNLEVFLKDIHILRAAGHRAVPGAEAENGVELSQESLHQLAMSGGEESQNCMDSLEMVLQYLVYWSELTKCNIIPQRTVWYLGLQNITLENSRSVQYLSVKN